MKQYEERINEILDNAGEKETDIVADQIRKAETALNKAEDDMNKALVAGNDTAYLKAKEARDNAEELIKMHKTRALTIVNGPLISEEEYERMVSGIMEELTTSNEADTKEVLSLCKQIDAIASRNRQTISDGNALLCKLQSEVYRYADCKRDKSGSVVGWTNKKEFKGYTLQRWADYCLRNSAIYTSLKNSVED